MTYDDVAAAFLVPGDQPIAAPVVPTTPARRLRDVTEPIATIGWWSRAAGDGFGRVGLDFFGGYVWGRSASLGDDVDHAVVAAAFGVFEPSLVDGVLSGARSIASGADVLAAREAGATAGLAAATSDVPIDVITSTGALLRSALDGVDGTARPFFSALRSLPEPADPHGRLWRAAEMYREHRGDGHLAACVAAGLDIVEMNVLTEVWLDYPVGEYSSTRGFAPERIDAARESLVARGWLDDGGLTDSGRRHREDIERATDASQSAVLDALGDEAGGLIDDLAVVADAVLAAHAAPADPRKRAAG